MARKIFITYKYSDALVEPLHYGTTARAYVDELMKLFEGKDEIYKGEEEEDLSKFKDDTIRSHLKDKIYDSSITLVLISPGMKELGKKESDQWIPWEISYSLKKISRSGRTSLTNGMLAVVLPDRGSLSPYQYFLKENACPSCDCTTYQTNKLFQILRENMFNLKQPTYNNCTNHTPNDRVHIGHFSYIPHYQVGVLPTEYRGVSSNCRVSKGPDRGLQSYKDYTRLIEHGGKNGIH